MDPGLSVVDIYGHVADNSEIILGVGNYNNVHGLLTYFPAEDLLQMRPLDEVITPAVLPLVLTYETPPNTKVPNRVYFSLAVKGSAQYINIELKDPENHNGDKHIAVACLSSEKAFFWIDYSSVDTIPRSQLLAGALYSLQTLSGEHEYVVSWKIQGFSNGDLVIFLPTTWYEQKEACEVRNGAGMLVESLHQLGFKGYTTQQWCEVASKVTHCSGDKQCGECLGPCPDPSQICYPNLTKGHTKFICGPPNAEPRLTESLLVSFNETTSTTNETLAWVAIAAIIIIVLITWTVLSYNL